MTHTEPSNAPAVDTSRGYEVRDTNVRAIVIFAVGLAVFVVLSQVGLWIMLRSLNPAPKEIAAPGPRSVPEAIVSQRAQLRDYEARVLDEYGRVDPKAKAVRIPIDRAIELLSERGIPPVEGPAKTEADVNSHSGKEVNDKDKGDAPKEAR